MSEPTADRKRVEELLRVNAELAAEVRNLTLGFADAPRPGGMPASRRMGGLIEERDGLRAELSSTQAELAALQHNRDGLERQNRELAAEIARLSHGFVGLLRRLRGRLLDR
jgi:cell division protein FtsB